MHEAVYGCDGSKADLQRQATKNEVTFRRIVSGYISILFQILWILQIQILLDSQIGMNLLSPLLLALDGVALKSNFKK